MLKLKIISLIAFVSYVAADSRPKVTFAPEILQLLRSTITKCLGVTGIDPNVIDLTEEGGYKTDEVFKKYVYCVYHTSKFSNSDGRVNEEKAISIFPKEYSDIPKVIKSCNKLVEGNPVETTYRFFTCFQENTPAVMAICYQNGDKNKNVCK